jgi:hypothetical protein
MGYKFEANNSKESNEALEHYAQFHDDYVAGIEIKFDNYKPLNGESTGIRGASMAIILSVNTRPYGKDHEQIVKVEFKDVRSFDISAPSDGGEGNWWGIMDIRSSEEGDCIKFDMEFIAGDARFAVVFSKMIITSDYVWKE